MADNAIRFRIKEQAVFYDHRGIKTNNALLSHIF